MECIKKQWPVLMKTNANYMPKKYEGMLYHYTSPEGFDSILFGNNDSIVLWASRYDCMNDMSEGKIVEEVYKKVCNEMKDNQELTEEMYKGILNLQPTKKKLIEKKVNGDVDHTLQKCNRYICSFSKNKDSLPMWNYYSKENRYEGYNIGVLSTLAMRNLEEYYGAEGIMIDMYPAIYEEEEQKKEIRRFLLTLKEFDYNDHKSEIVKIIRKRLSDWGLLFKSEYFQHEEEIRIIIDVPEEHDNTEKIKIKYRSCKGMIIPYIEIKLNKNVLKDICLGPLQCNEGQKTIQKEIVMERLKNNGYRMVNVNFSNVPVRY